VVVVKLIIFFLLNFMLVLFGIPSELLSRDCSKFKLESMIV
jgi:hypothetical protein